MLYVNSHLIYSKKGVTYDFSCAQVDVPHDLANKIQQWGMRNINNSDVYNEGKEKGREDEFHVTIKYGLHDSSPDCIRDVVKSCKPFEVTLGDVSRFTKSEKYDVVKIEAESVVLHDLHHIMSKTLDNTDEHPIYKPHLTISYIKKGTCVDLSGCSDFKGQTFMVNHIVFSSKNGQKTKLQLKGRQ